MKRELWITCVVVVVLLPILAVGLAAALFDLMAGTKRRDVDGHGDIYEI